MKLIDTKITQKFYSDLVDGKVNRGMCGMESQFNALKLSQKPSVKKYYVNSISPYLDSSQKVLDLGCGSGGFLMALKRLSEFRLNRERLAIQGAGDFIDRQYRDVADTLNISKDEIYKIIHLWLVEIPTQVLYKYRFDDLCEFLNALKTIKIKTAILPITPHQPS